MRGKEKRGRGTGRRSSHFAMLSCAPLGFFFISQYSIPESYYIFITLLLTKTDYVVKLDDMKYNMFEFLQGQVRVILFYVLLQGKFTHFIYFLSS